MASAKILSSLDWASPPILIIFAIAFLDGPADTNARADGYPKMPIYTTWSHAAMICRFVSVYYSDAGADGHIFARLISTVSSAILAS